MDKYYQPKIEEFHVGFEYEAKEESGKLVVGAEVVTEWIPTVFTLDELSDYFDWGKEEHFTEHLEYGNFRVKFLDREGIESLGFNYGEVSKLILGGDKVVDLYNKFDNLYTIHFIDEERTKLFEGIINNKSELKRILRQTGIL